MCIDPWSHEQTIKGTDYAHINGRQETILADLAQKAQQVCHD